MHPEIETTVPVPEEEPPLVSAESNRRLHRISFLLALGWLGTNLSLSIGEFCLKFLLKDGVGMNALQISRFFAIGQFTNYIKPVAGVMTDSVPLFGTRRRHYILWSIGLGGLFWLLLGIVPRSYGSLLLTYTFFYITVVVTSTSLGGRMVEVGIEHRAAGRLSAQRIGMFKLAALIGGPIAGILAGYPFGLVMAISSTFHFGLVLLYCFTLPETPTARPDHRLRDAAVAQFRSLLQNRVLLCAALLIFLVAASPGFNTPLLFYQTNTLKFSKEFVGTLLFVGNLFAFLGAFLYHSVCRRFRLRELFALCIVLHALGTLFFLGYRDVPSALVVTAISGLSGAFAMLPVYDLAARATPRGGEAMGYSVMMSVWNLTNALSDWSGSYLYDVFRLTFRDLVWVNAGTTALVLLALPFLPAALMRSREGEYATR